MAIFFDNDFRAGGLWGVYGAPSRVRRETRPDLQTHRRGDLNAWRLHARTACRDLVTESRLAHVVARSRSTKTPGKPPSSSSTRSAIDRGSEVGHARQRWACGGQSSRSN